ncbi:hypothetical protein M404DRAFT_162617, partial [Pisolithus tinctorius Marx 270]
LSRPVIFTQSQLLPNFGLSTSFDNISVCLIDYSETLPVTQLTNWHGMYQPAVVRTPEVILGHPWSSSVDTWTIECLVRFIS